jgi:hypothetical protein
MLNPDSSCRLSIDDVVRHPFFGPIRRHSLERFISRRLFEAVRRPREDNYPDIQSMRDYMKHDKTPRPYFPGYTWIAKNWSIEPENVIPLPTTTRPKQISLGGALKHSGSSLYPNEQYTADLKLLKPALADTNPVKVAADCASRSIKFAPSTQFVHESLQIANAITSTLECARPDWSPSPLRPTSKSRAVSYNQSNQSSTARDKCDRSSKNSDGLENTGKTPRKFPPSSKQILTTTETSKAQVCPSVNRHKSPSGDAATHHSHEPKSKGFMSFLRWLSLRRPLPRGPVSH